MVNTRIWAAASLSVALSSAALGACSQDDAPLTQLILVADTDIAELDTIHFTVSSPDRPDSQLADAPHSVGNPPGYVSIIQTDGSLGPLTVTASGISAGQVRLARTQRVSFVAHETRVVLLHLFSSCLSPKAAQCDPAQQTCAKTGCVPQDLSEAELLPWTGVPPSLLPPGDAGVLDGSTPADAGTQPDAQQSDASAPTLTACGPAGIVDTQTDLAHCGSCEMACIEIPAPMHAFASCVGGHCVYACTAGWGDCDGKTDNGCEADLVKPDRCGSCMTKCDKGEACVAGTCG